MLQQQLRCNWLLFLLLLSGSCWAGRIKSICQYMHAAHILRTTTTRSTRRCCCRSHQSCPWMLTRLFVLFCLLPLPGTPTYTVHTPTLQLLLRKLPKCHRHILSSHTQQQLHTVFVWLSTKLQQCLRWHCSNHVSNHADSNKSKWLLPTAPRTHKYTHTAVWHASCMTSSGNSNNNNNDSA